MGRVFNITGACIPEFHYMVDIRGCLEEIKELVDNGAYFTINRARQYGKTTVLTALQKFLDASYIVVYLDFQFLSQANFKTEASFVRAFTREFLTAVQAQFMPDETRRQLRQILSDSDENCDLGSLFFCLSNWCAASDRSVVLLIDEVDSASNNQVFLDFLSQLRGYYIHRMTRPSFQSVILAGVYDVKNIKRKIRTEDEHKVNSPWNIAADFEVVMSFSKEGIAGMLSEYEKDHHTDMDVDAVAGLIYDYTSGYPFLVSRICKLIDEKVAGSAAFPELAMAWSVPGVLEAVRILLSEKNTLFESLTGKLYDSGSLRKILYDILFGGRKIIYNPDDPSVDIATMFGFVKNADGMLAIANRLFETRLYNYFLAAGDAQNSEIFAAASDHKSQYLKNGRLDMDTVMQKFVEHFDSIYGDQKQEFDEEEGRRRFLLYLRPIINGTGNYYIEAETRNSRRMDVVVDYLGERFVIELKIWRGNSYHERGEQQLSDYLDYFQLKKGYMLSYNFNKKKETGVEELHLGDKVLVEAVV